MTASATSIQCGEIQLERNQEMPFANFKTPEAALTKAQMEDLVHKTTQMSSTISARVCAPTPWC